MSAAPRILCISFSNFLADSRVLRQLDVLREFGEVTTIGYGDAPPGVSEHLEVDASLPSLPQTPLGVLKLAVRAYRSVELDAPAMTRALLPRTDIVSTINSSIAHLYQEQFGVESRIVRNAIAFQGLSPSPMQEGRIRLVHSGGAVPGRSIETLIEATKRLDERFTLDLYLVKARGSDSYWDSLVRLASASDRVRVHDPVAPSELPSVLNAYDLGVFVLPPRTTNHKLMLPNKFFDFVQARLGLVFSPAVETDALIRAHDLGRVTDGFEVDDLVAALQDLTAEDVARYKENAHRAADILNSREDQRAQEKILNELLARD
jgi:hypothetical protein